MKRFLFSVVALFSIFSLATEKDITEFPVGSFLGEGKYFTTAGQRGTYSSYADIFFDEWTAAYVRDGQLTRYTAIFDFSDLGFFNVDVIQYGKAGTQTEHQGHGYCVDNTCHLAVDLLHGTLEETLTFITDENRIERLGSLMYFDQNGDQQTIVWEEDMVSIDDYDESEDEKDERVRAERL